MSSEGTDTTTAPRRLRLGMVGGGRDAFIGGVHRIAARLDDRYELVAGAFSADAAKSKASAAELRVAPDRAYGSYPEMAAAESERPDGIDAVAIVTPNHVHHGPAKMFLEAGIHVICDKPLTTTLDDALDLAATVKRSGLVFGLTHNYTGYPMVRQAREMVRAGELGAIRVVQAEYPQDWLSERLEETGQKQAAWRTDPARAGAGGSIGDIGTHAFNLAAFITGLQATELCADLSTFVDGRALHDNAHVLLRYDGGTRGMLWSSQVAPGNENALRIRVYGEKGGLEWQQEHPNQLHHAPFGEPPRLITRGGPGSNEAAGRVTRIPPGHPEGYLEGFANIYGDVAEAILAHLEGRTAEPAALDFPGVEDGVRGVKFIDAVVQSSRAGGVWTDATVSLP
ncbi:MAG: Gfo/Idh/MocA family oxidoreductase [Alphaproteobacteria bacterium]|jgi:predicted dehydrogenase|nr:Gfo/Idh/MocA family oxidoreductase [Alphaproteobacteria bacterium]MDP6812865.1 Gfo/Idh/MocA family oxidoreductase [Alphaproteobacteria bacterium]